MATTPEFAFDSAFKAIIKERGETHVFFINGMLISPSEFDDRKDQIGKAFNLIPEQNEVIPSISSVILDSGHYNKSLKSWVDVASSTSNVIGNLWNLVFKSFNISNLIATKSSFADFRQHLAEALIATLYSSELTELIPQYFLDSPSPSSYENNLWVPNVREKLGVENKDSFIFTPHSQGNFFMEDALQEMASSIDANRLRILAMASPTNYYSAGFIDDVVSGLSGNYRGANIKNSDDPITYFQSGLEQPVYNYIKDTLYPSINSWNSLPGVSQVFSYFEITAEGLTESLANTVTALIHNSPEKIFNAISAIASIFIKGMEAHKLVNYLKNPEFAIPNYFKQFAYELQPQG